MKTQLPCALLGALLIITIGGCKNNSDSSQTASSAATPSGTANGTATGSVSSTKGTAKAPVQVNGKAGSKMHGTTMPKKANKASDPLKMTASQEMGINILKTMNATPALSGHKISVGTTSDTVILNGSVKSEAQKKTAEIIARQKAPKAKITNKIEVSAK